MITGISGFGFFSSKMPFREAHLFFKKCFAETPIFIVFFVCAFWPSCQKKRSLDTHKKLIDNRKVFLASLCFFFHFCFLVFIFIV